MLVYDRNTDTYVPAADRTVILYDAPGESPEQPESPDAPDAPKSSSGSHGSSGKSHQPVEAAPTGDTAPVAFYLGLLAAGSLPVPAVWLYARLRYRRSRKPRS